MGASRGSHLDGSIMGTLSGLFNLSRTALTADQAALTATADNVANQNTAGYVRQVVSWRSGDSVILSGGSNVALDGPVVTTSAQRDRVLEQRVQQQTQAQAETGARANVLSQIEGVFSITGSSATAGSTQIGTAINGFFASLTALGGNPADAATRQGVLSSASLLAASFNAASTQIGQVAGSVRSALGSSITAVNSLTATIAQLNAQISTTDTSQDGGALEDQRQLAITQLSQYVGLDQVKTEGNGISLTTQGGTALVAGSRAYSLAAVNVGSATEIRNNVGVDVSGTIAGGSIGGQLTAQHTDLPTVSAALDALAYRIATAVNTQNQAGVDASGSPAGAIFAVTASATGAAAALAVLPTSTGAIAAAASAEGVLGNTNANALADLALVPDATGATIAGSYASLLGQVGTQSSTLSGESTAQAALLTQLTTERDRTSGVSLDEEAGHLSEYQRSYEAAAKLFAVLNTLLGDAINLGQATTVA